ncbi:hypothetical protein ACLOJK_022915 [Asimina triloba]
MCKISTLDRSSAWSCWQCTTLVLTCHQRADMPLKERVVDDKQRGGLAASSNVDGRSMTRQARRARWVSGVRYVQSWQFQDRLNLVVTMDGVDCVMECLPVTTSCLGCFDGWMMLEKKMFGAIAAVIEELIMAIGFDHKNWVIVMVEAISPAMKETSSSLLVIDGGAVLRPHRILDQLDVVDMMNDMDFPMEVRH